MVKAFLLAICFCIKNIINVRTIAIIAMLAAKSSSSFAHLTNMLIDFGGYEDDAAWAKVREMFKNLKVLGSSSGVWKGVRDGEYTIGLSYEDPCLTLINDGADVEVIYMEEGVVFLPAGCAIIKDAKHPEAAKLFMDFITSKEV